MSVPSFSRFIPQTTLGPNGLSDNFDLDRSLYLTLANLGTVSVTVSVQNSSGVGPTLTVIPGQTLGPLELIVRTWSISGVGGVILGIFTSPPTKVNREALLAMNLNATIPATVKTDVGQGTGPVAQVVLSNPLLTPYDSRDRLWALGATDAPDRGWTLGSGDVPNRGWLLGSTDVPNRGWTLGSGDTPQRSWALGSSDSPDTSVNQAHPKNIRSLVATDNPDSSVNQANPKRTDVGQTIGMEEAQVGGNNYKTYDPWGFVTTQGYSFAAPWGGGYGEVNVQQSGARGYLWFNFYVMAPTTGAQSVPIYLYRHLPTGGPGSGRDPPQYLFTLSWSQTTANIGQWVGVAPDIFWPYDSIVVAPLTAAINSSGDATSAGVLVPLSSNNRDSNFWNNSYWNTQDSGFIGYWYSTNSSLQGIPVQVTGTVETIVRKARPTVVVISTTASGGVLLTAPTGKRYLITDVRIYQPLESTITTARDWGCYILTSGQTRQLMIISVASASVASSNANITFSTQSNNSNFLSPSASIYIASSLSSPIILNSGDALYAHVNDGAATLDSTPAWEIHYEVEDAV